MRPIKDFLITRFLLKIYRYVFSDGGCGAGQIFDKWSYAGNIRGIIFFCFLAYAGKHIDDIGRWLFNQFGETLIISPGKEVWHSIIGSSLGIIGVIVGVMNMLNIYIKSRIQSENTSLSTQVNVVNSETPSTKPPHTESENGLNKHTE